MLSNISGFPELLPREQIAFNQVINIIKEQFELNGFIPLDTPAVERVTTLLAKGNDSEIYGIHRLAEGSGSKEKDLALRFDLTVPLARYVAQHYGQLTFPYRRYHIAPVWRGERPQAGRYRQFYQCDFDIIGDGELPLIHDSEVLSIAYNTLKAIGLNRFNIIINNRYILTGLIKSFGIVEENVANVMRVIDKAEKISLEDLRSELTSIGLQDDNIKIITDIIKMNMDNDNWIKYLQDLCQHPEFITGLQELKIVLEGARNFGIPDQYLKVNPALARGLNYYTGTVSETKLLDYPELGSICGGGRYANLAATFSKKQLPGVGLSIGISRLMPKLIEAGIIESNSETTAAVLVTTQSPELMLGYMQIAAKLRVNKINTEIYLAPKPLANQMKYADKKKFKFVIIAGEKEIEAESIILRSLVTGEQSTIKLEQAIQIIKAS